MGRIIRAREKFKTVWKCGECEFKVPGDKLVCPECGSAKEQHEHYEKPEKLIKVERPSGREANLICEHCRADAKSDDRQCSNCGGPLIDAGTVSPNFGPRIVMTPTGKYQQRQAKPPKKIAGSTRLDTFGSSYISEPPSFRPRRNWLVIILVALAIGLVVSLLVWTLGESEVTGKVSKHEWRCVTTLYRTADESGSGWCDRLPSNARETSRQERQDGTVDCEPYLCVIEEGREECNCRTIDRGIDQSSCRDDGQGEMTCDHLYEEECQMCPDKMGTCYKQCQNMRDWCKYIHPVERGVKNASKAGTNNSPICPVIPLSSDPTDRTSSKTSLTVQFTSPGNSWSREVNMTDFQKYQVGTAWTLTVGNAGDLRKISPPQKQ